LASPAALEALVEEDMLARARAEAGLEAPLAKEEANHHLDLALGHAGWTPGRPLQSQQQQRQ
jgi:hypothetical protein